jgi:hypothetical protein
MMWITHGLMFFAGGTLGAVFIAILQMERLEREYQHEPDWDLVPGARGHQRHDRHLRLVDREK